MFSRKSSIVDLEEVTGKWVGHYRPQKKERMTRMMVE
jgi:hypothetical protein